MNNAFQTPATLTLEGTIDAKVLDPNGSDPVHVIQTSNDFEVEIDWELTGLATWFLNGDFHIHVLLESMGPGPEFSLWQGVPDIPVVPTPGHKYNFSFPVAAGTVSAGHEGSAYRMIVSITHRNTLNVPTPIVGFADMGLYQFYNSVISES